MTARHVGLLAFLAALWGASYLLIKYALDDFGPAFIVFARTAIGALVLWLVILVQGGEARAALADIRRRPWSALGLGAVAVAVPFLLITVGELHVASGLTAVLIAPASLFVALFAPLLDRTESIRREQGRGLVVGLVGVALLVGVETVHTLPEFLGALAILAASACYAVSAFVVKNHYRDVPSLTTSFVSVGAGALLSLPAAAAGLPHHLPGVRALLAIAGLAVGATALGFVVFYVLISEMGAGRASLVSYLAPAVALAFGAVLLDERITVAAIAGLVLIFGGVALAGRRRAVRAEAPAVAAPR